MSDKIESLDAILVDLPLQQAFVTSKKRYTTMRYCLVRVTSDSGAVGYGESRESTQITGETGEAILAVIRDRFGPALAGLDPFDMETAHVTMEAICQGHTAAKSAVDIALYDLMGRLAERPVCRLLGGKKASSIQSSKAVGLGPLPASLDEARRLVAQGFKILKLKTGIDPDAEIKMIREIRRAVGSKIRLKLDANQGWTLSEALRVLQAVEDCRIEVVEQPLPAWDLKASAELRRRVAMPIMLDEGVHSAHDVIRIYEAGAADMINIKFVKTGGIYPAQSVAATAQAAGMICQIGSLDTSIGSAAAAHVALAWRNIRYAEIVGPTRLKKDAARGLTIDGDQVIVGDAAGLGIEVDWSNLSGEDSTMNGGNNGFQY
jgi:L-alanine-DL-glutamate epimerase-like enolase superfamily enzyme